MLIIDSWFENDFPRDAHHKRRLESEPARLNEQEIKSLVSKCILDEIDGKAYRSELVMNLSQKISKRILRELTEKHPSYKLIIQTFLGREDPKRTLFVSSRLDQRTDHCLTITENNGQM